MPRTDLEHAAELLDRLLPQTTPGPWRDSSVDGNRYHALVSPTRHPDKKPGHGWDWDAGYGGCLVAESVVATDRRLLAVLRNVADDLPALLRAVAAEDPIEVGRLTRRIATAITDTHRPAPQEVP
jgi:hypothetical protein